MKPAAPRVRTRRINTTPHERDEQVMFVKWFRARYSERIIANPNGGKRNIVTASRLKEEGVTPGVPDIQIPAWHLWIEMKRQKGGSLSAAQKDWIKYLRRIGDTVFVCKGFREAMETVEKWRAGK